MYLFNLIMHCMKNFRLKRGNFKTQNADNVLEQYSVVCLDYFRVDPM